MSQSDSTFDISALSAGEKLDLIGRLWDSIPDSSVALPTPEWHRRELDERLAAADANPGEAIPWDDVKRRLGKSL